MTTGQEPPSATDSPTPDPTVSEPVQRTRSGRVSKPPVRYEPVERVEDDYATDEYDEDESDVGSEIEYSDSELEDEEADSEMDDFIVEDKSESDEEDNGSDGETTKPQSRGAPAAKRPTVAPVRKSTAAKK